MSTIPAGIYSATYSNVPVFEFSQGSSIYVMRRRADDWINATHILKAAAYDKPARTRILEREVQKGVHEKVQGGYGKYQGTWIPLHDGRILAERNNVLEKLLPIFDFVPGDRSPPPAPKHASLAQNKAARAPRKSNNNRVAVTHQVSLDNGFDRASMSQYPEDEGLDNMTIVSESMMDDDHLYNPQYTNPRKRKRAEQMPIQDQQHQIWADALLDYFMLLESEDPFPAPPSPPPGINIDKPIDDKGHTALHWAAAMGDIDVVKDLIQRHARIECASNNLETPLMRAVLFTNNYDKQSMAKLVRILAPTVTRSDWFGSTVFHHIAATTSSKNKYLSARYYLDTIIGVLSETWIADEVTRLLNIQDQNGDTAIMIAARNGARKCVRSLLGRHVAVDQPNALGETADDLIRDLNARRQRHIQAGGRVRDVSSSPFAPDGMNGNGGPASNPIGLPHVTYRSQTATSLMTRMAPGFLERFKALATALESEYEEKASEASEAERVAKKRILEFESLKRQVAEMEGAGLWREVEDPVKKEEDDRENEELNGLIHDAEALLEMESRDELRSILASIDGSFSPNASFSQDQGMLGINGYPPIPSQQNQNQYGQLHSNGLSNGMPMAPMMASMGSDQTSPTALAAKLTTAQRERQRLVRETVLAMSVAGLGERQADYKRLIYAALGARSPSTHNNGGINSMDLDLEREGMLDEILRELEEERRIAMAEQADENGSGDGDGNAGDGGEDPMTGGGAGATNAGLDLIDPAMEASMSMIEPAFTLVGA